MEKEWNVVNNRWKEGTPNGANHNTKHIVKPLTMHSNLRGGDDISAYYFE